MAKLQSQALWREWYDYFPWEDHLSGMPKIITHTIVPVLLEWANSALTPEVSERRRQRIRLCWGVGFTADHAQALGLSNDACANKTTS